jgi:REP element-mobilizing transposase RayT
LTEAKKARRSIRLPGFDYSRPGNYFVTILADRRRCLFGRIEENETVLTPIGETVKKCWIEIPQHFLGVGIESYVVMPNHLHGILAIAAKFSSGFSQASLVQTAESFGKPVARSIPTIIRSFKAAVTKRARESDLLIGGAVWQRGYFERVLRDGREFVNATDYIIKNPSRWAFDEENPERKSSV